MRKLVFVFALLLSACSQPTKEELARQKIKEFIQKNANDPSSYESIEYGKLEEFTEKTDYDRYSQYVLDSSSVHLTIQFTAAVDSMAGTHTELSPQLQQDLADLETERNAIEAIPVAKFYRMRDRCRGKNKLGVLTISNYVYRFDSVMNVISCTELSN